MPQKLSLLRRNTIIIKTGLHLLIYVRMYVPYFETTLVCDECKIGKYAGSADLTRQSPTTSVLKAKPPLSETEKSRGL